MKKLLIIIVLIALGVGWFVWQKSDNSNNQEITIAPETSQPNPANASFMIEDEEITLKNGVNETDTTETILSNTLAYGDVNGDGKNDTALLLIQNGGGSGTFVYLAVYVSGNVTYKGSEAVFLGDRISPQSLSINKGVITVKFLDRKENEPMASEPTVLKTQSFVYKAGTLEER